MALSPWQYSFNGFVFGAGTPYGVETAKGLASSPTLRVHDSDRGYQDGSFSGRDFLDSRHIIFDFVILGDATHSAFYYYQQLQKNLAPQQQGLYPDPYASTQTIGTLGLFQFELSALTGNQRMWGRVRNVDADIDPDFSMGFILATVEFYFPDPRYYDETALTASGSTIATISNAGWAISCPAITIATPSASGSISDSLTGASMSFANINTGYPLVIDLLRRTISQNGLPSRNVLSSMNNWLTIPANTNSGTATWISTIGSMALTWRNAYL